MNTIITLGRCPLCGFELPDAHPLRCVRPGCGVELARLDDARLRVRTFRLHDHFSLCVLPFAFEEQRRGELVERLGQSPRWTERVFSLDNPDDVDRTEYFLPYIRRFLFPTLFEPRGDRSCWQYVFDL